VVAVEGVIFQCWPISDFHQ